MRTELVFEPLRTDNSGIENIGSVFYLDRTKPRQPGRYAATGLASLPAVYTLHHAENCKAVSFRLQQV
jgi:hypothetical protein